MIQCPACKKEYLGQDIDAVAQKVTVFHCPVCGRSFTVRTVFLLRDRDIPRFRERLREGMEKCGFTQQQLGDLLGFTGAYVSHVLKGKRVPARPSLWLQAVGDHDEEARR